MDPIEVALRPALPPAFTAGRTGLLSVTEVDGCLRLENRFLAADLSTSSATVVSIRNLLTGHAFNLTDDCLAGSVSSDVGDAVWRLPTEPIAATPMKVDCPLTEQGQEVRFSNECGKTRVTVVYLLARNHFWLERRVIVEAEETSASVQSITYGRCTVPGAAVNELVLGAYDRPRLSTLPGDEAAGGVFAGMGWWFYNVDGGGTYRNDDMRFPVNEGFESAPWYLGVFQPEPGEPYPGWHWYKAFLQQRKDEYDRRPCWFHWNAGWGQWGIDMNHTDADVYFDLCQALGLDEVLFGSGICGLPLEEYAKLVQDCPVTNANFEKLRQRGLAGGCIESGARQDDYSDPAVLASKRKALETLAAHPAFGGLHFDFFYIDDSFRAKRMAADYLRRARELLPYTECHLGMAKYGPQYQREVQANHPTDLAESNLSVFSSDWLTWAAFRRSRIGWQHQYNYLIPEVGLYYFVTHYHNGGHPRKYTDPEPAQILYGLGAYCGCAFNFHDRFGYRNALVATTAFTPHVIFGYLERHMPEADVAFTRSFLAWVRSNVKVLRQARVCFENERGSVVSKVVDGKGAVYLLNYSPETTAFRLDAGSLGLDEIDLRELYPRRGPRLAVSAAGVEFEVPGESVIILEVNDGLCGDFPPTEQPVRIALDLAPTGDGRWQAEAAVPDIAAALAAAKDDTLPERILVIDLLGHSLGGAETGQQVEPDLVFYSRGGETPACLWEVFGVESNQLETWKVAPWAFADRAYFTMSFSSPPLLSDVAAGTTSLTVNGNAAPLMPRIDNRKEDPTLWECPLLVADVTDLLHFGQANEFVVQAEDLCGCAAKLVSAVAPARET